jgi:hypothetical protein
VVNKGAVSAPVYYRLIKKGAVSAPFYFGGMQHGGRSVLSKRILTNQPCGEVNMLIKQPLPTVTLIIKAPKLGGN